eukprot:3019321-Amphidinium_carterae.1
MATPEQVQELEWRIQAMEAREAEGRAREQMLHTTVQNLTTQLATLPLQRSNRLQQPRLPYLEASRLGQWTREPLRLGVLMSGVEAHISGSYVMIAIDLGSEGRELLNAALLHIASSLSTTTADIGHQHRRTRRTYGMAKAC